MSLENPGASWEVVPSSLEGYRVVDIREAEERVEDPFPLADADWAPLSALIEGGLTSGPWIDGGPDDRPNLLVCRAGVRSLRLTQLLREQGLANVYSLPGGVQTLAQILNGR